MKISLNIIKKLTNIALPSVDELTHRINEQLGGVEEIIDLNEKYKDARIVRVVQCEKHPNADRLNVTKIDDGGVVADVPRDENGYVQVVCGAPNVHADMWAIWLPPKATVPASFSDDEPFVLGARPLRGILSQGMLAAADELDIGSDHAGIVEINEGDAEEPSRIYPGASFAEAFGLNDTILDIENKMFTHRPDCFGQIGVAREIAGILGEQFSSPDWYAEMQQFDDTESLNLNVFNEANELVPRYMAVAIRDITVKSSPLWLQCQLVAMGVKPINNVVDATNYIMLMTAQPTHAYDYDTLRGGKLGARMAQDGETVKLLNDKTYKLTKDDIVIADADGVIGLAGIMGGKESEVTNNTKNIVLEVATFDMYALRKTAMKHGVFTDALTRFNKGQSPRQNAAVMKRLMSLVDGAQASSVIDLVSDKTTQNQSVRVSTQFINTRLGYEFSSEDIKKLLTNVEINTEYDNNEFSVIPPFWRTDLEIPEDVVEEVGRLYGFDKLPRNLPVREISPVRVNHRREIKNLVRHSLSKAGANEVLTYSFVHEKVLKNAGQDSSKAYKLSNALSPELQYYRFGILPSLLEKVHANIKSGHNEFVLFEIGKGHDKGETSDEIPEESNVVDAIYASRKPKTGAAFFEVRHLIDHLAHDLGIEFCVEPIDDELKNDNRYASFDDARSAAVKSRDGQFVGVIGELKQSVVKNFKLPKYCAAMSLQINVLESLYVNREISYEPLSRYPSVSQDISLKSSTDVPYKELLDMVKQCCDSQKDIHCSVEPIGIYQPDDDRSSKTTTFHIVFTSYENTLEDSDVKPMMDEIATKALTSLDAERI